MSRIEDSTDKLTVGNGVNGVNMASSRKASKNKIPTNVHLVAPTDESRKKESSWSEHTWSKYSKNFKFRGGNYRVFLINFVCVLRALDKANLF